MEPKGIVVNAVWISGTICAFTAHLAFTRAVEPELAGVVMTAKLVCGALAVWMALAFWEAGAQQDGESRR